MAMKSKVKIKSKYYEKLRELKIALHYSNQAERSDYDYDCKAMHVGLHSPSEYVNEKERRALVKSVVSQQATFDNVFDNYISNNKDRFKRYLKHLGNATNEVGIASNLNLITRNHSDLNLDYCVDIEQSMLNIIMSQIHHKKLLRIGYNVPSRFGIDHLLDRELNSFRRLILQGNEGQSSPLDAIKPTWNFGINHSDGLLSKYAEKTPPFERNGMKVYKEQNLTLKDVKDHPILKNDKFFLSKDIDNYVDEKGNKTGVSNSHNTDRYRVLLTFPVSYPRTVGLLGLQTVENKIIRSAKFIRNVYDIDCYRATWWKKGKNSWSYSLEVGYIGRRKTEGSDITATCSSLTHIKDVTKRKVGAEVAKDLANVDW